MKIVSVYPSFANKGGAEDMAISIGIGLNEDGENVLLHLGDQVFEKYQTSDTKFEKFNLKNIKKYHKNGSVFLSHHRKTTTFLMLISRFLFRNKLRVIHVAHNPFLSLKRFTLYPKHNIAVSHSVKKNLISYFGVEESNIDVIYNGIKDHSTPNQNTTRICQETTNILYLGRIVPVKQQVEFVKQSKGRLDDKVHIYFAGIGNDYEALATEIADDRHYSMLGLIDTYMEFSKFDYVCLFSVNEWLPLSLIEGEMYGKPLLTNTLPQSLEVNVDNVTGYVSHSWDDIISTINKLPSYDTKEYKELSSNSRYNFKALFDYGRMIENYKNYIASINWG